MVLTGPKYFARYLVHIQGFPAFLGKLAFVKSHLLFAITFKNTFWESAKRDK